MHSFPPQLWRQLEDLRKEVPTALLSKLYERLSSHYRDREGFSNFTREQALAYALARMPATFQVLCKVLSIFKDSLQEGGAPVSWLDMGSGPGTTYWAYQSVFPQERGVPSIFTCIEQSPEMGRLLLLLTQERPPQLLNQSFALALGNVAPHAVVSCSYVLGEMGVPQALGAVEKMWGLARQSLILVEPGTPSGFSLMMQARETLIAQGAFIWAPCGHNATCPLKSEQGDWCHFPARLGRTEVHQAIKKGTKPYEDEKFCYLIALKPSALTNCEPPRGARILKKPRRGSHHIELDLCRPGGVERRTFTKSKSPNWSQIRKKQWGDVVSDGEGSTFDQA